MIPQNKLLGQHWLTDTVVLDEVVEAADVVEGDTVVEIGPGLGTLTERLLAVKAHVFAIEKDKELAARLSARKLDGLTVVEGDILTFDLNSVPVGYKVAANIPYYLTSPLIRMLLESSNPPSTMALLIQKEVAERITASPGSMSILSVAVQYYAAVELGSIVPPDKFDPPPKVDSQIITVTPYEKPVFEANQKHLFRLVKAGFSEKRKKLINALSGGLHISKIDAEKLTTEAALDQNARAQELGLDDWERLYKIYIAAL